MSTEKDDLETSAITQFAAALSLEIGAGRFEFIELRKPPEPDGYCMLDGQPLYVEVGHVYGTPSDAMRLLGRAGTSAFAQEQQSRSRMLPLDSRVLVPLNRLLADKASKSYAASRVWLLVRSAYPLWDRSDFEKHIQVIEIPKAHPFEQVWLLCGQAARAGILRLA